MNVQTGSWTIGDRLAIRGSVLLILILLLPNIAQAQEHENTIPFNYTFYTSAQGAVVGETPFWHYANTYGHLQHGSQANWLSGVTLEMPYQQFGPVEVASGAELTSRVSDTRNSTHFTQLYGALQYQGWRLRIGRFRHTLGLHMEDLSVGSMIVSRNATPMPKIELTTPGFVNVPLSNERLRIRAYWAEGRLEEDRDISRARVHQKAVYLKAVVSPNIQVIGGLVQSLQWAGTTPEGNRLPSGFRRYRDIVFNPKGGGDENAVASYDIGLEVSIREWEMQAYRQFFLYDWISLFLSSPWDGLWGVGVQREEGSSGWVNALTYEFVNTIQQDAHPGLPKGRARYYSHHTYVSGWTYHGNVLGNPLLRNAQYRSSRPDTQPPNLMVIGHHLGMRGSPNSRLDYSLRFTYSRNYGICEDQTEAGRPNGCTIGSSDTIPPELSERRIPRSELRQDQYATLLDARYLLSEAYGLRLRSSVAVDWGEFDGTQIGFILGLQWDGTISL